MQTKVNEYFNTHPDEAVVYGALGVLFSHGEDAHEYLGGTGKEVEVFHRPLKHQPEIKLEGLTGSLQGLETTPGAINEPAYGLRSKHDGDSSH